MSRLDNNVADSFIGTCSGSVRTNMLSSEQVTIIWCSTQACAMAPKHGPLEIVVRHDLSQHDGSSVRVCIRLLLTHPRILVIGDGAQILFRFNLAAVGHIPGALFHHNAVNITSPRHMIIFRVLQANVERGRSDILHTDHCRQQRLACVVLDRTDCDRRHVCFGQ